MAIEIPLTQGKVALIGEARRGEAWRGRKVGDWRGGARLGMAGNTQSCAAGRQARPNERLS